MSSTPVSLLARACERSESTAWEQLIALYDPMLRRWLVRYSVPEHDSDDLLQEVFRTLSQDLPQFRSTGRPGAFRNWLRTVLVHRLKAYWRQEHRRASGSLFQEGLAELEDPNSGISRLWDQEHDRHVLGRLMNSIRVEFQPASWNAFEAVMLRGESPTAAAARLGVSVNAVFLAKSRILRRLRQEARDLLDP